MALFRCMDVSAILYCKNMQTMNISAIKEKGKARIEIKGTIAGWRDSEKNFTRSVEDMIREGIKDVHLYINSPGGDCFEANEIVNVIRKFPGKITGEGGALVASAATYIASDETRRFIIHGEKNSDRRISTPDSPKRKYRPFQNTFPVSV